MLHIWLKDLNTFNCSISFPFPTGVLVDLHHAETSPETGRTLPGKCGKININAVQQVVAAKWAVDVINNQSKPHDLKIGESPFNTSQT